MGPTCDITMKAHVGGIASINTEFHGAGYGDMCAFIINALTMSQRKKEAKEMVEDFRTNE